MARWWPLPCRRSILRPTKKPTQIYVVSIAGGEPVRITNAGTVNERPRWSPDSKQIAFISDRGGSAQVWMTAPDGTGARQVTSFSTEAGGVLYSPDGKNLVFTSEVFPDCPDDACNKRKLDAEKNSKVHARIYDSLLYRHWTRWQIEAAQPSARGARDRRNTEGSHSGRPGRAAVLIRRTR